MTRSMTTYTTKLTDAQSKALHAILRGQDYEFREVPYASFAAAGRDVNAVYYQSGKLVVQGKGVKEFVEFLLEPLVLQEAKLGYETVLNPELLLPRIGVDESGKGDFFGPLCVAGVYVNAEIIQAWTDAGIKDSKSIGSDNRIHAIAQIIRETRGVVYTVVPIGNEAYNRLYLKMRSVNQVLAWGHARVIENLMGLKPKMNPPPVRAISDQFAADKGTVSRAMMAMGREIELVQRHKAESDVAVAAASILARDEFVTRLKKLGRDYHMVFPKGASDLVDKAAKDFVEKIGPENLSKVAKVHFRTALRAQGLPEPEKKEWRKPKKESKAAPEQP
ncbi:MAG: ribonuclease HIII [Verrucomicrobiales bacterium]